MNILYSIFLFFYRVGIALAAPFNRKAKLWQQGRKEEFSRLSITFNQTSHPIWVHCASLGEYEQAKPVIQKLKSENPACKVLVTFFSPSGYEIRKDDPLPDYIFYLPMDFSRNARRFIRIVQPKMAIFIKYEFWFHYMHFLHEASIPFYYVSAIFRPGQYFFKSFGHWFANRLREASFYFVQNEESESLLHQIHIDQVEVCGDTRFDRVYAIANQDYTLDEILTFKQNKKLLVAGSTWEPDELLLSQLFSQIKDQYQLIVAPHEISRLSNVLKTFETFKVLPYTQREGHNLADYDVLIIDTMGLLSKIYKYSDLSYIGGAFKTGLHNILEAGVFGVPLFFGPHYQHFNEAVRLVQLKGAFSVTYSEDMLHIIREFEQDEELYRNTCTICRHYVESNIGAGDKIFNIIKTYL